MSTALSEEDELGAAELALELIEGSERAAAEARLRLDPDFRAAYGRWLIWAAAMIGGQDESPRPSVWPLVAAKLPANDAPFARDPARPWQAATAVASIAAVLLAGVALNRPPPPRQRTVVVHQPAPPGPERIVYVDKPAPPPLVAVMTGEGGGAVAVSYNPKSGQLTLAPAKLAVGDKAAELWVIPVGQKPHSLGLIRAARAGRKAAPADLARYLVPGATLAVSVEPQGGSPTGQPTGPVIVAGAVTTA